MNCDTVRNRMAALPDPAAPPAAWPPTWPAARLARPGTSCWSVSRRPSPPPVRRPAQARARPAGRPVPRARARRPETGGQAAREGKARQAGRRGRSSPERQSVGERLARLWPAGLVAAALLAGVLVWSSLRAKSEGPTVAALPPDPFLERVVTAKVKLDSAPDAAGRLAALDTLERTIHEEATTLSKVTPGADMEALARMYEQVVTEGMVEQARLMSGDERKAKLPAFTDRLSRAEQDANRLAAEAPPGADRSLKGIAKAAEKGRIELARMIQG